FSIKIDGVEKANCIISIYDVAGKEVYNNVINQLSPISWNPKNLQKGIYLINLISEGKIIETKKVVYQ
ncbi:MAG: hypothetical protein RLZZ94_1626, partial [Bacteroidota bacterium]